MFAATQPRRPLNSFPGLTSIPFPTSPNFFSCHTSENSPVSPTIATLPKTRVSNPCVCHTYDTPLGVSLLRTGLPRNPSAVALVPFWNSSSTQHSSFFSTTYALPILQVLSFDVHPSNGGVYPPAYQLSTSKLHLSLVVKSITPLPTATLA